MPNMLIKDPTGFQKYMRASGAGTDADPLVVAIGGPNLVVRVTHTVDTNAYVAGDLLADVQAIAGAVRVNGGTTELRAVTLVDVEEQNQALDIVFVLDNTSLGTENSAPNMSDANGKLKILGVVQVAVADWRDCGGFSVATPAISPLLMQADTGATSIYVGLITRGAPTHAGGELVGVYAFVRD